VLDHPSLSPPPCSIAIGFELSADSYFIGTPLHRPHQTRPLFIFHIEDTWEEGSQLFKL
jgi:hypothetical protein